MQPQFGGIRRAVSATYVLDGLDVIDVLDVLDVLEIMDRREMTSARLNWAGCDCQSFGFVSNQPHTRWQRKSRRLAACIVRRAGVVGLCTGERKVSTKHRALAFVTRGVE